MTAITTCSQRRLCLLNVVILSLFLSIKPIKRLSITRLYFQTRVSVRRRGPAPQECRQNSGDSGWQKVQARRLTLLVVAFLTGGETCSIKTCCVAAAAASQRDRHQLAAPGRPAEEEVPPPGVQRHRILEKTRSTLSLYTNSQKHLLL